MKQGFFTVVRQDALARGILRMELEGDVSAVTQPGQFVEIALPGFFLRRPISVCDCHDDRLVLIYKVVGAGTETMATLGSGAQLDILTGLGHGFDAEGCGVSPLLVGGGVGVPPLYLLARRLLEKGVHPDAVLGFNRADEVFYAREFEDLGVRVVLATADGSAGVRGFVTDALPGEATKAYACGPMPMLRALDKTLPEGLPAEFSLEERMGCGFGACMGCSIMTRLGSRRVCKAGPVFARDVLVWDN